MSQQWLVVALWGMFAIIGFCANCFNFSIALRKWRELKRNNWNGERRLALLRQLKTESSVGLSHLSVLIPAIYSISFGLWSPLPTPFSLIAFFGQIYLAYCSVSRIQDNYHELALARRFDTGKQRFLLQKKAQGARAAAEATEGALRSEAPIALVNVKAFLIWPDHKKAPQLNFQADFEAVLSSMSGWDLIIMYGSQVTSMAVSNRLLEEIKDNEPQRIDVFYVAAHGFDEGILMSDKIVSPYWLASKAKAHKVNLVVLAACDTSKVANSVRRAGVKTVIYMQKRIEDAMAINMMSALFDALSLGWSAQEAVNHARSFGSEVEAHSTLHVIGNREMRITSGHKVD